MASGNSNLARAALTGDAQLVARLLGEGRDVNEADELGWTALVLASQNGHVEVVQLLLARQGVEVNMTAQNGATALSMAAGTDMMGTDRCLLCRAS